MITKKFSNALGGIGEDYINEILTYNAKRKVSSWVKLIGIAACLCIVASVVVPSAIDLISSQGRNNAEEPLPSISLRSIEELDTMREMIQCKDKNKLNEYLISVEGGGAKSRDNLITFVDTIDSLPILHLIEGDITWISIIPDKHNTTKSVAFISTQAANGEWTRIEYLLGIDNNNAEIEHLKKSDFFDGSFIDTPIQSSDGRIKIYSETRKSHTSDAGETIMWLIEVDGILANVIYYSKESVDVQTKNVFDNLVIRTLK